MNNLLLNQIIATALEEDVAGGDITSEAIFDKDFETIGTFLAKTSGVIAGLPIIEAVFNVLDPNVTCLPLVAEGSKVTPQTKIATVKGPIKSILTGERVALNFIQHLSGIATYTAKMVELVGDNHAKVVDTRKTTPGLRMLEKYAVRQGGGINHRYNLSDAVLIKDNHIAACGSLSAAVARCKAYVPHTMRVEVETETEAQVLEALEAKADIIMLDNMSIPEMKRMVELINGRAITEASGGINESTIADIAATGIDIISIGALTHSVKALDISLDLS